MRKKYYDKFDDLYLIQSVEVSEVKNIKLIEADGIRDQIITKFVNPYSEKCKMTYTRLFEIIKDFSSINNNKYCIQILKKNKQIGEFFMFAEESKNCLVINKWEDVIEILDNLPYMNVYITNKELEYVIALTQEDTMVYTGIEFQII